VGTVAAAGKRVRNEEMMLEVEVGQARAKLLTLPFHATSKMLRHATRTALSSPWVCSSALAASLPGVAGPTACGLSRGAATLTGGAEFHSHGPTLTRRSFASSAAAATPPRYLVTGAGGQIGVELCRELRATHGEGAVVATDFKPEQGVAFLDVTDEKAVADGEEFFLMYRGREEDG